MSAPINYLSFVLGAALAGLAGAFNAHFTFFISPDEYGFERGVEILAMGVLGGTGSPWGAAIGGIMITLLPELLRGFGHYRPLINGMILDRDHSLFAQGSLGPFTIRDAPAAPSTTS